MLQFFSIPFIVNELRDLLKENLAKFSLHYDYDQTTVIREIIDGVDNSNTQEESVAFHLINPNQSDKVTVTERSRKQIVTVLESMLTKLVLKFGEGKPNTASNENDTEGPRRAMKGIHKNVLKASFLDSRTRTLSGIPPEEEVAIRGLIEAE